MFTHSDHCCIIHGCTFSRKYNDRCSVCKGEIKQTKICGRCIDDIFKGKENKGIIWQDKLMENQMDKINSLFLTKNRKFKINKINKI